jgi:hypothetical protein
MAFLVWVLVELFLVKCCEGYCGGGLCPTSRVLLKELLNLSYVISEHTKKKDILEGGRYICSNYRK